MQSFSNEHSLNLRATISIKFSFMLPRDVSDEAFLDNLLSSAIFLLECEADAKIIKFDRMHIALTKSCRKYVYCTQLAIFRYFF